MPQFLRYNYQFILCVSSNHATCHHKTCVHYSESLPNKTMVSNPSMSLCICYDFILLLSDAQSKEISAYIVNSLSKKRLLTVNMEN